MAWLLLRCETVKFSPCPETFFSLLFKMWSFPQIFVSRMISCEKFWANAQWTKVNSSFFMFLSHTQTWVVLAIKLPRIWSRGRKSHVLFHQHKYCKVAWLCYQFLPKLCSGHSLPKKTAKEEFLVKVNSCQFVRLTLHNWSCSFCLIIYWSNKAWFLAWIIIFNCPVCLFLAEEFLWEKLDRVHLRSHKGQHLPIM